MITEERLKEIIRDAYEDGAKQILKNLGLDDKYAVSDIRTLRDLLKLWNKIKDETALTVTRFVITAVLLLVIAGLAAKLGLGALVSLLKG